MSTDNTENQNQRPQTALSKISLPPDTDSTYPRRKTGPTEAVLAVWAVLSENWPNQFKKVDANDPAGVWAANIDDLSSRQIHAGLKAIARSEDRYMPNAPNCRKIILEAAGVVHDEPIDRSRQLERDPVEHVFKCLIGKTWIAYVLKMSERGLVPMDHQTEACRDKSYPAIKPLADAWRSEQDRDDRDTNHGMVVTVTNQLLNLFNRECVVPVEKQVMTYEALYGE